MQVLGVWLGQRKIEWDAYARSLGLTSSALAAQVIKNTMDVKGYAAPVFVVEQQQKEWGQKKTLNLKLSESEMQALEKMAAHEGVKKQRFVIGLLRASMANEPQHSTDELMALRESNTQLRKIGVSLNAIAKQLNQGMTVNGSFDKVADKTVSEIKKHTEHVSALLNSSEQRWRLMERD